MRAKILIFFYKYYKCFAKNLGMFYEKHLDIFLFAEFNLQMQQNSD